MADREIKIGLATYTNEAGQQGCYGFQGDTVKVHEDDLERFDELNEQPGGDEPFVPQRVPEEVYASETPAPKKAAPKK
jgi:hypothetical protein